MSENLKVAHNSVRIRFLSCQLFLVIPSIFIIIYIIIIIILFCVHIVFM